MITLHFFWGGGCLICGPPVKDLALGVSVVILDGAYVVQILKGVETSTVQ